MPTYDVPGVYIEEITGPGVIAGVGTSTAAFIGPALNGPINEARRVSSWDEFLSIYATRLADGSYWPYITTPKWFYLAHGVRSFFQNGGQQAYIVRIGTGQATRWRVNNQNTPAADLVFTLQAKQIGAAGDNITVQLQVAKSTAAGGMSVATATAKVNKVTDTLNFDVDDASNFRVGDVITQDLTPALESLSEVDRAVIANILGNTITLVSGLKTALSVGNHIQIASIKPTQASFRMANWKYLAPGSVVYMTGYDPANLATQVFDYVVLQSVDQAGFVTPAGAPARTNSYSTAGNATAPPNLTPKEFKLIISVPGGTAEQFDNLSLSPLHPGYVFAAVTSNLVNVLQPASLPLASGYPASLVAIPALPGTLPILAGDHGVDDDPGTLASADYSHGLDLLRDIEDVNLLCIPDAAVRGDCVTIQTDMIQHCLLKGDRFAILDSQAGVHPTGNNSVEQQRQSVQADRGFAALYYPWLVIPDPTWKATPTNAVPATMTIPPS
jgi:hypothetical protein